VSRPAAPEAGGAPAPADGGKASAACSVKGWSVVPALPADCQGLCQADSFVDRLPKLSWLPRPDWCSGCMALDTPWAKTDAQRQRAMDGYLVATGAGPDLMEVGMFTNDNEGMLGLYDGELKPHAGFYGLDANCGRLAAMRFSHDGKLGAHVMQTVGKPQAFYQTALATADAVFQPQSLAFTWPTSVVGQLAINDMWFSSQRQVIDLTGNLWVSDLEHPAQKVASVPGAPVGEYAFAEVKGEDVFVSRWVQGATDWYVYHESGLVPFLGGARLDVKQLVTDGRDMVWIEGSNPVAPTAGGAPWPTFSHYALYRSPYTTDPNKLTRELLADDVHPTLSYLVLANGYVVGTYLIQQPVYRSAALVVRVSDHQAFTATVPGGYSWGYQLYPTPTELWGPVTAGPMITFETLARFPYSELPRR